MAGWPPSSPLLITTMSYIRIAWMAFVCGISLFVALLDLLSAIDAYLMGEYLWMTLLTAVGIALILNSIIHGLWTTEAIREE